MSEEHIISEIRTRVVSWEERNWIPYPWRVNRTPYKVLVAELLLKRTTRQAVAREFSKFISRLPDIYSVYNASISELEEALRHLGLYRQRAKHFKELAKVIVERYKGVIPDRWDDLVSLPGLGVYMAGAILSFGYGKRAPVVDSNVLRLLSRLTGIQFKSQEECLNLLWPLVPEVGHEYFNYGLIDLGALVCYYGQPRCNLCPLKDLCVHYTRGVDKERAGQLHELYQSIIRRHQGALRHKTLEEHMGRATKT